jgi:hypothetical protein
MRHHRSFRCSDNLIKLLMIILHPNISNLRAIVQQEVARPGETIHRMKIATSIQTSNTLSAIYVLKYVKCVAVLRKMVI